MLRFDPPELFNEFRESLSWLLREFDLDLEDLAEDIYDFNDPDFDPAYISDETIRPTSLLSISLPRCDQGYPISYEGFVQMVGDLKSARFVDNVACFSETALFHRVEPVDWAPKLSLGRLLDPSDGFRKQFATRIEVESQPVQCQLTTGITPFAFMVWKNGLSDKYFPPALHGDLFVEIRSESAITDLDFDAILVSYLYELAASTGLVLGSAPRLAVVYEDGETGSDDVCESYPLSIRPLKQGKGLAQLQSLYLKALRASDPEIEVLFLTQVLEFVSQTVIRLDFTEKMQAKLSGSRALAPDAEFIGEIQELVEAHRVFRKDSEAIRLTVDLCCEATEISRDLPECLKKTVNANPGSNAQKINNILQGFSKCVVATRNEISHAKPNYEPTGSECPREQLPQLCRSLRNAAQQAIGWYHNRHESTRVS